MKSREIILNLIKKNKPSIPVSTKIFDHEAIVSNAELLELFKIKLEKSGAVVNFISEAELHKELEKYSTQKNTVIEVPSFHYKEIIFSSDSTTEELNSIDISILEAQLGVAENGALWIDEDGLPHRAVPFITQDLMLILSGDKLVANMHEAYKVINIASSGYGIFIAGPSKTADIEQSLVIGAHGAKSLRVFIF
ncbi:MAG: LUD domain-containing protein [Bacteroidota bacterium]|nr:LUD domain-containing protein [Bacteroidota bacterium]